MQGARDELQQGGLAGAVAAHEADPLALVHRHRGAVEQQIALNAVFKIVNVQHGSALFRPEVPAGGDSMPGGWAKATAQGSPAAGTRHGRTFRQALPQRGKASISPARKA